MRSEKGEKVVAVAVIFGSYRMPFSPRTAGAGCDPCDLCGRTPAAGDQIWMNSYGDLIDDDCMSDRREAGSGGF